MKKIILMGLSVLLLAGCGEKEYTLEEVITPDSTFGVNTHTTLDELKSKLALREVRSDVYISNKALKPYKLFDEYTYAVNKGKICSVQAKKIYDAVNYNEMKKDLSFLQDEITNIYGVKAEYITNKVSIWSNHLSNLVVLTNFEYKKENRSAISYLIFIDDCPAVKRRNKPY